MRRTATQRRGIPGNRTALCHLGVDTEKYKPDPEDKHYAHELFKIPREQKLIFYSGHFEPRKGISVIMEAANILAEKRNGCGSFSFF
jgi:glycosyltransferase involved in cell wall biosynthesis